MTMGIDMPHCARCGQMMAHFNYTVLLCERCQRLRAADRYDQAVRYASVFRAAADGVAGLWFAAAHEPAIQFARGGYLPGDITPAAFLREVMSSNQDGRPLTAQQIVWLAYDGIATMFEKITQAEQQETTR